MSTSQHAQEAADKATGDHVTLAQVLKDPPKCPHCPSGGRVGPSAVGNNWHCYKCGTTF